MRRGPMKSRVSRSAWILLVGAGLLAACGGADRATRKNMLEWAQILQFEIATSQEHVFPKRLGDIDTSMRSHLSRTDAWGKELLYRRLREDFYHLISAGPDGQFGNADDIVCVTGHMQDTMTVYAETPIKKNEMP
jgi:hypothetical protein